MKLLKSPKGDIIFNSLSPLDPKVQRYISLSKEIERLMDNAEDKNDACVSVELIAEFFVLQEELYQLSICKHEKESN